eukprot:1104859-Pleurochrysis_carterae.AAC.2
MTWTTGNKSRFRARRARTTGCRNGRMGRVGCKPRKLSRGRVYGGGGVVRRLQTRQDLIEAATHGPLGIRGGEREIARQIERGGKELVGGSKKSGRGRARVKGGSGSRGTRRLQERERERGRGFQGCQEV